MGVLRRFGVGFAALLAVVSTAVFAIPTPVSAQSSSYGYELIDTSTNTNTCGANQGEIVAIRETEQTASGSSLIYYWCPTAGTPHEFARVQGSSRIVVTDTSPDQGTLTATNGQTSTIAVANPAVFSQAAANQTQAESESCESSPGFFGMGWAACPLIGLMSGAMNWLDSRLQELLHVGDDRYTNPELHNAWKNFRNVAYSILIPLMLVMVISTALNMDTFSAYTVKKALPRMVIAIIFIALSWHITTFLIGFFNTVGHGIVGLMTSPFGIDNGMNLATLFGADTDSAGNIARTAGSAATQLAVLGGALAGLGALIATGGGGILLLYLIPAIGFILTAFLVLTAREIFILACVLFAPLAILAWIFPGNDRLWKLWWSTFSKLLMMFPFIMVVLGAGRIFAHLINTSGGGGAESLINPLLKLTAYLLPYLFIPFAYKFAGGMISNLAGFINDREKGLFDRARKARGEGWHNLAERYKDGKAFRNVPSGSRRAHWNERVERLAHMHKGGFATGEERKGRIDSALGNANLAAAHQAMKENHELAVLLGNEDYTEAGRSGKGHVMFRDENNKNYYAVDENGQKIARDGSDRAIRAYLTNRRFVDEDGNFATHFINSRGERKELGRHGYSEEDVQAVRHARRGISQDVFNIAAVLSIPGTGTGFGDGAGQMDAAINETVGDNRRVGVAMLAEMRGTAERAGRGDLKGGGFGKRLGALQDQYEAEVKLETSFKTGEISERQYAQALQQLQEKTTLDVTEMTVFSTDSRGIAAMKPGQIKTKVIPNINLNLDNAIGTNDQQDYEQQLARIASLYDQAQYASPEVQGYIGELMSRQLPQAFVFDDAGRHIPGAYTTRTVREAVESVRNHQGFLNYRRELGSGRTAAEVNRMSEAERMAYEAEQRRAEEQRGEQ